MKRIETEFPFELPLPEIPNELTAETLRKPEADEELCEVANMDELFEELN